MKDLVEVQLVEDGLQMKRYIYIYTVYHADGAEELIEKHNINYLRENRKATRTTKVTWTPTKTPAMNSISNSPEAPTVI
jgi:IS30 family transposase